MDLKKIYYDSYARKCNILQLVKKEPEWAADRIQEGEKAISELIALKNSASCPLYTEYKKSCKALKERNKQRTDNKTLNRT